MGNFFELKGSFCLLVYEFNIKVGGMKIFVIGNYKIYMIYWFVMDNDDFILYFECDVRFCRVM